MAKKRVSVQIEGRNYALITDDDEKYVQNVANEVTKHIQEISQNSKQFDVRDCAVLAALDFCDDRNKAAQKNIDYVEKADKIIRQANDLNKMCKEYKEKLTEAINENTGLVRRIKELEKKLSGYTGNNNATKTDKNEAEQYKRTEEKKKNERLMGYVPMKQVSLFDEENNEKN